MWPPSTVGGSLRVTGQCAAGAGFAGTNMALSGTFKAQACSWWVAGQAGGRGGPLWQGTASKQLGAARQGGAGGGRHARSPRPPPLSPSLKHTHAPALHPRSMRYNPFNPLASQQPGTTAVTTASQAQPVQPQPVA